MKRKNTMRNALVTSIISMLLCVSMLVGTTFAWFTDSVVSANNVIKSGNLDIDVQYTLDGTTWADLQGAKDLFQKNLWEPGHTEVVALKITNKGSLALKYTATMNIVNEIVGKSKDGKDIVLSDILTVSTLTFEDAGVDPVFGINIAEKSIKEAFKSENGIAYGAAVTFKSGNVLEETEKLLPGAAQYVAVKVDMAETVGNEANHDGVNAPSITFGINVLATQYTYEKDSFGKDYDEDAKYDREIWDGMTTTTPVADAEGVYHITTAAELVGMMNDSKYPNNNKYQNVVLENNIDLMGNTIPGFGDGSGFFDGTFDGQGYTISNFKIDATDRTYYAGLFNQVSQYSGTDTVIKNLTVSNATIRGTSQVGAIVGGMNGNTIVENCKVIDCELYAVKKVGSVVGYTAGGTVKDCYAEDCTVVYSEKEGSEILGYENTGSTVSGNTFKNVVVAASVATADELLAAVNAGATNILLADGEYDVKNCGGKTLTISGSKNAVLKLYNEGEDGCDYGFGGPEGVGNVTFNGLTIDTTANTGNYKGYAYMKGTFNDCNFVGAYSLNNHNDFVFNRCTFDFKNGYFWTWGAKSVSFDGCIFNGNSKTILAHGSAATVININDCTFAATEKGYTGAGDNTAVVEMDPISSNTYTINFTGENTKTEHYAGWTRVKDGTTGHIVNGLN